MNCNFGEVLIDQSSRAFYDDYDDLNLNKPFNRPLLKWRNDEVKYPDSIKQFIIVEGINAQKILESTILKNKNVLCSTQNMKIYEVDQTVVAVVEENDVNYFSALTELLNPWIKVSKECILVELQPLSKFLAEKNPESIIIRSINPKFENIPLLESPNFICGVVAGVCTKRIMMDLQYSCDIIYVDFFDEVSIKTILNHLKKYGLSFDENSVKIKPLHHSSDLYM